MNSLNALRKPETMTQRDEKILAHAYEISERGARNGRYLQAQLLRDMAKATWQSASRLASHALKVFELPMRHQKH